MHLRYLPVSTVAWAAIGYTYGKLIDSSPRLMAQTLAIWAFADSIFLYLANASNLSTTESSRMYAYTNLLTNSITIIALKRLSQLNSVETAAFSCLAFLIFSLRIVNIEVEG